MGVYVHVCLAYICKQMCVMRVLSSEMAWCMADWTDQLFLSIKVLQYDQAAHSIAFYMAVNTQTLSPVL